MYSVFIRGHLFTKKFFTFLIGSTFLTNKIKTGHYKDFFTTLNPFNYEKTDIKEMSYYIKNPEKFEENLEKRDDFIYPHSNFTFLSKNIQLSFDTLFYYIKLFGRKNIAYCEIPKMKKPYLGCAIRANEEGIEGMKIIMIKSDSPAEKAGLKVKDIIVEIDGKKVATINDYNAAIGLEANKKKMKIVRFENGGKEKEEEVEVEFIYSE
jgi:C-terminal processing protease CtpA/Prc